MNSAAPSVVVKPEPASATAGGSETDLATLLDEPASHAWYRRPTLWAGAALLIVAALGACIGRRCAPPTLHRVTRRRSGARQFDTDRTANGTLQPTRSIAIGSELSGTVLKVNVDVNDRIRKGQVLVELDTSKLHDQILRSALHLPPPTPRSRRPSPRLRRPRRPSADSRRWRACRAARCRPRPSSTALVPRSSARRPTN